MNQGNGFLMDGSAGVEHCKYFLLTKCSGDGTISLTGGIHGKKESNKKSGKKNSY